MYNKMDDDLVITGAYNPAEWVKYRDDCEKIKEQYDYLKKN